MGGKPPALGVRVIAAAALLLAVAAACGGEGRAPLPTATPTATPIEAATATPARTPTSSPGAVATPPPLEPGLAFSAADGRFTVYRMYERVQEFVAQVKTDPGRDPWEIYRPLVVEPMRPFFGFLGITHADWEERLAKRVRSADLEALAHTASLMAEEVDGIAQRTLDEVGAALDATGNRSVFLLPGQFPYNEFTFYGHVTAGASATIFLYANAQEDPRAMWREMLPGLIAHEAHHSIRLFHGKFPLTLIGQTVTEGLADIFAEEMYGSVATHIALDAETERRLWSDIKAEAFATEPGLIQRYLQGDEGVPAQSLYYIGQQLIQAYKASHPGTTAAGLVGTSEFEIFEESGYEP